MKYETAKSELLRLFKKQNEVLQDEVFGGLTNAEWAEYNARAKRINELEIEIQAIAEKKPSQSAEAEQRRQWNKPSETDTHRSEARQPYRSREKDSANSSTDSGKRRGKRNKEPGKTSQDQE
jgi:hypothetical protein